jgi:hypothetical protein
MATFDNPEGKIVQFLTSTDAGGNDLSPELRELVAEVRRNPQSDDSITSMTDKQILKALLADLQSKSARTSKSAIDDLF